MKNKTVVGISGFARSGKDHFCNLLIQELHARGYDAKRFALADRLKNSINPFFKSEFDIDIWDCEEEEKEFVRPLLVAYGKAWRLKTSGRYWTNLLESDISKSDCEVAIVTDIRYAQYSTDEIWWLREHLEGTLVHLKRYDILPSGHKKWYDAPNEDEVINDPLLWGHADYRIEWGSGKCYEDVKKFGNFIEPLI